MLDAARRLSSVRILDEAFRGVKRRDEVFQRQTLIVGKFLCLLFFTFRFDHSKSQQVDEIVTTFDKWDNIEHFLMSDPFKVLLEFQHLIRNQVSDKTLMNMEFFEHMRSLVLDPDTV